MALDAEQLAQIRNGQSIITPTATQHLLEIARQRVEQSPNATTAFQDPVPTSRIENAAAVANEINNLQFPHDRPKYWMGFLIQQYSRQSLLRLGQLTTVGSVIMPLPLQLVDGHQVDFEETPLSTFIGTLTNAGMQMFTGSGGSTTLQSLSNDAATKNVNTVGNQVGVTPGNWNTGGAIPDALIGSLADSDLAKAIIGYSPNQFMTILLKGPQYKRHEFSWRVAPKTPAEAETLRRIVRRFNNAMAPGLALSGALFTFPLIFRPMFMPNPKYLFKFKPCVLESFSVNYSAGGVPAFYRADAATDNLNAPESMEIKTRFLELEFWLTGDFNETNDPTNTDAVGGENNI